MSTSPDARQQPGGVSGGQRPPGLAFRLLRPVHGGDVTDDEGGGGPAVAAAEEQPLVAERLDQCRYLVGEGGPGHVEPQAADLVLHARRQRGQTARAHPRRFTPSAAPRRLGRGGAADRALILVQFTTVRNFRSLPGCAVKAWPPSPLTAA